MGIFDRDELRRDFDRLYRYPLPAEIEASLLTETEVNDRLAGGSDPVALSITKWEKIASALASLEEAIIPQKYYSALHEWIGYETCALCRVAIAEVIRQNGEFRFSSEKCAVCPLGAIDRCIDETSTFAQIDVILSQGAYPEMSDSESKAIHRKLKQRVLRLIRALQSVQR